MNDLPVILSYFAQSQDQKHLDMLIQEISTIGDFWEKASARLHNPLQVICLARKDGLSSRDRMIEDIQSYGRRIVLFQFSGHAGHDELFFSDGVGGPDGIAGLLATHAPNLKLVLLNGCSTNGQVNTFFERGIRAVLATNSAVQDSQASQFAITFHERLCADKPIQEAYRDAILTLKSKRLAQGVNETAVSRSMLNTSAMAEPLWGLFTQDTEVASISDANWWAISGQPNTNQPRTNFYEAAQYQELKRLLDDENNVFAKTKAKANKYPDDTDFSQDLIRIDERRTEIQKKIDVLKEAVLKLAEEFTRIPINTARLRLAKAHFDSGEYEKARAIFDTEKVAMKTELDALIDETETLKIKTAKNQENRINKANEYLLGALATAIAFDLPDRFEKTKEYFELSLKADRNAENLFAYGNFLREHNQFKEALLLFIELLRLYRQITSNDSQDYLPNMAATLTQLAASFHKNNDHYQAQIHYEEALLIYRKLAKINPQTFLFRVAQTLNNLAYMLTDTYSFAQAPPHYFEALEIYGQLIQISSQDYRFNIATTQNNLARWFAQNRDFDQAQPLFEEALRSYRQLAQIAPKNNLPLVAQVLNNLALMLTEIGKFDQAQPFQEEALQIRRNLAQLNPQSFLPTVAQTLNNLGMLFAEKNEPTRAEDYFAEALQIRKDLAQLNPQAYLPDVATTAANMSRFYLHDISNRGRSLAFAEETLRAAQLFKGISPRITETTLRVLEFVKAWGEDPDAFLQRVKDSIKTTDQ